MPSVIAGLDEKPAVVRPRPEGEQSQALGTMLPRRLSTLMGVFPGFLGYNVNVGVGNFSLLFFFFLGGVLDFDHLFCCWCHVSFPFSHVVVSFVFACCLGLLYMILVPHTLVSARVSFTSSSVSVLQMIHSVAVAL